MGGLLSLFDSKQNAYRDYSSWQSASPSYSTSSQRQSASPSYSTSSQRQSASSSYSTSSQRQSATPSYSTSSLRHSTSASYSNALRTSLQKESSSSRSSYIPTRSHSIRTHSTVAPTQGALRLGHAYDDDDLGLRRSSSSSRRSSNHIHGTLTVSQIEILMERANSVARFSSFGQVHWIYRDKPPEFFNKAFANNGVMTKYSKDHSGDQKSPINGRINGLFFATEQPPSGSSYFGSWRILVPASFFMSQNAKKSNRRRIRLYFADFYCMTKMHWVTLVLTYEGSVADRFCDGKLPELDLNSNDFFYVDDFGVVWKKNSNNFRTEIFYTEDVDLYHWQTNGGYIKQVNGLGTSNPNGKPKRRNCSICNL